MKVLYWLESIRAPWLDAVMLAISQLGGEILFMAIVIALFWCMDKRKGYYLMTVGFFGIVANQFLKLVFRVSRPWIRDPEFTIVEGARAGATGYSFPSGHTQNAAAVLGCPARMARRTRRGCALLIAPSAVLAALGFILPLTLAGKWVRAVRLLPMIVLCALSVARVAIREPERQRRPHDQRPLPPERGPRPLPMHADTPEERQRVKRRYRRAS